MELSVILRNKLDLLTSFLKNKKIIVAFSGGVDSSLLAYLSNKYAKETLLLTVKSILNPSKELEEAKLFAKTHKIPHQEIVVNPLDNENFVKNYRERCYICKKDLFEKFIVVKQNKDFDLIIDGSNADDKDDFRPGIKALEELDIKSPYILFDITKQEIRDISKYFNLKTYSKPSGACFASRIPYSQKITESKIQMIREAESYLKSRLGFDQLRVRYHEDRLARIELPPNKISEVLNQKKLIEIKNRFKELGFVYITIDIEGFRSGSLNKILN